MKVKALATTNITVLGRTINAVEGLEYELTDEELKRIPYGYFEVHEVKKRKKEVD